VEDITEKEQLEALRTWWSENGSFVMGGVIVGVLVIFGWNRWQAGIAETETAASTLFEDVMESAGRRNLDTAIVASQELFDSYGDTEYAAQGRLAMARMYMDSGRDKDAADALRPLAESGGNDELALVGRLRLAKILLYQDKPQEVVDLLKGQSDTAFAARFGEVLGDAYVALGSYAEAEAAYIAALNDNPAARTVDVAMIQLKINDLPLVGEVMDGQTEAPAESGSVADEANAEASVEEAPADAPAVDTAPADASADSEPEND
jgi:predicted negative regulator of RcsB-dependent stress response